MSDRPSDSGLTGSGPAYSDVVLVRIEDNGTTARVIIDMRGNIPSALPSDEVVGVGVNLYRDDSQTESEYQIFVDGEPEGWFAYLTGPQGFVDYPGTFQLGGRRMAFELPWSALGDLKGTGFDCFSDWSKSSLAPQASEDHAPDSGRAPFSR